MDRRNALILLYRSSRAELEEQSLSLNQGKHNEAHEEESSFSGEAGEKRIASLSEENSGGLPYECTKVLMTWFLNHLKGPYPTVEEKEMLARQTRT